ncbi:DUF4349 domain-containing protein [Streptomyces sp. NPDC018031]|uniref:DUF4349 domain-containing protein n=1 Tax=Streptomyces sp. NPDC018031 TaxID=3365033 RepID=UPI0037B07FD6
MRRRKPITVLTAALLTAALTVTGCQGSDGGDAKTADGRRGAPAPAAKAPEAAGRDAGADPTSGPGNASAADRPGRPGTAPDSARKPVRPAPKHVIRTATVTVRTKDVAAALDRARGSAERAGGYVGDEDTDQDREGNRRSRLELRVPPAGYDGLLADLSGLGKLVERRVTAQDVTDQVVDVESRIASQRASVARVRELMDRAEALSDVVALEGELSTRQADLEALQAQRAALRDQTGLATVTLVLYEPDAAADGPDGEHGDGDGTGFGDALAAGWKAFTTTARWVAVAFGVVLPFAVTAGLVLGLLRLVRRRFPARTAAIAAPAGPAMAVPGPVTVPGPVPGPAAPATAPRPAARRTGADSGGATGPEAPTGPAAAAAGRGTGPEPARGSGREPERNTERDAAGTLGPARPDTPGAPGAGPADDGPA